LAINSVNFNIPSITQINPTNSNNEQTSNTDETQGISSFGDFLKNELNKVNDIQQQAAVAEQNLATGQVQDIHSVTIAVEKSELALQLTLAIRNKIMDAYAEIMRMQV